MRLAEYDHFGRAADVTVVRERPLPQPSTGEVLVKVRAAALNPKDVILRVQKALAAPGHYVSTVPKARIFVGSARTLLRAQRSHLVMVRSRARDLRVIAELVEQGRLRPIVHGVYSLEQAAQAQEQVESKHSRGKVVIRI